MSSLPYGWTVSNLGACADWYSGGTPDTSISAYWSGDIPWITASSLHNFYITQSERQLTKLGIENGTRLMPENTIIFVVRGMSLKTEFRIGISRRAMAFGQDCKALTAKSGIDAWYLAYAMRSRSREILGLVDEASHGTGRLQTDALKQLEILIPPLAEQERIAASVRLLDDKIELNRRMNATLEEMARAVFRKWFVENEEVGNWKVGKIEDDFNLTMGQSPPGDTYNEKGNGVPFFQGRADFGFRFPSNRVYCIAPTRFAAAGDTLISVRAPVGDLNMAVERCAIGRGVAAIRHKTGSRSYTYYAMQSLEEAFKQFEAEGTVFGSINKTDFQNLKVVIPPSAVVEKFEEICQPIDQMIENNSAQSRTLASLRDTLLPKLMRGEVRVSVAEGKG